MVKTLVFWSNAWSSSLLELLSTPIILRGHMEGSRRGNSNSDSWSTAVNIVNVWFSQCSSINIGATVAVFMGLVEGKSNKFTWLSVAMVKTLIFWSNAWSSSLLELLSTPIILRGHMEWGRSWCSSNSRGVAVNIVNVWLSQCSGINVCATVAVWVG